MDEESGSKSVCPRCSTILFGSGEGVRNALYIGLAALILMIPASLFPFLDVLVSDNRTSVTLLQTAFVMVNEGLGFAGLVIFCTAFVFPVIYLFLMVYVSYACVYRKRVPFLWDAVRVLDVFRYFQMTDVFLVGILVSVVKLLDMAQIRFGNGFYFLVAVTVLLLTAGTYYDKRFFWCRKYSAD